MKGNGFTGTVTEESVLRFAKIAETRKTQEQRTITPTGGTERHQQANKKHPTSPVAVSGEGGAFLRRKRCIKLIEGYRSHEIAHR